MTRRAILFCILLLSTSFIVACYAQQSRPGGYIKASVTQKEVMEAAAFAIKAQLESMQEAQSKQPPLLELVKILSADEQVVAGINYRLKLLVRVNGSKKQAEAVVWWQSWRKPYPYELTSWTWRNPSRQEAE